MSDPEKIDWDKLSAEWDAYWRANTSTGLLDVYNKFWEDRGGRHRYFFHPDTPSQTPREYVGQTSGEIAETLRTMDKSDIWRKVETPLVPQNYDVRVTSNFHEAVVMDWVTVVESGLRLLLRRVCGASETQCNEFIKNFDDVGPNIFNGVNGQEGLSYTLTAIN